MITVKINTSGIGKLLKEKVDLIRDRDKLMQFLATSMLSEVKVRVHQDGLDSNGQRIGTYSPAYMKVRTGLFSSNDRFKRGKNKGKTKAGGVYTRGAQKGQPRKKYNRTSDTKVILSLTRQMENDMVPIPTETGYGIGYTNPFNKTKALWQEATYNKKIWSLTPDETQKVFTLTNQYLSDNAKA